LTHINQPKFFLSRQRRWI